MKIFSKFLNTIKHEELFVNDRRSAKRYDLPLKLNYSDPATKYRGETLTSNISKNGLRFPITTKISKGTVLDLQIEDPHSHAAISSKAKIIWIKEFVIGDDAEDVIYEAGVKLLKRKLY